MSEPESVLVRLTDHPDPDCEDHDAPFDVRLRRLVKSVGRRFGMDAEFVAEPDPDQKEGDRRAQG